ncbi:hypothetical protein [Paludibaculum fermentans]|uniref:hypothetical protein n=1 Tax=Paludibaculum fermentans TaxID=1473598 RepID=UPI003EBF69BF
MQIVYESMAAIRCLLLLSAAVSLAYGGGDCAGPGSFCAALRPGMVAFIGTPVSSGHDQYQRSVVTFQIAERLVGLADAKRATVVFADGYSESKEPRLFLVTPTHDGLYWHDDCGSGLALPLSDPLAKSFRRDVANRAAAKFSVVVKSAPGWVTIPGVRVQMRGNGRSYEGLSSRQSPLSFATVPSGEYELTLNRPHFLPARASGRLTVLPGSCGTATLFMESASRVSGRLLDFHGEPVAHARIFLKGTPQALGGASMYDWAVERVLELFTKRPADFAFFDTKTASDGRFEFTGVYPGWYRLVTDLEGVNQSGPALFPETYYPGVSDWPEAAVVVVEEGQSINNITFRLPDFGTKRNVVFRVVDEGGLSVADAKVLDYGYSRTRLAAVGVTDSSGNATVALWPNAEYTLFAEIHLPEYRPYFADPILIPAGRIPANRVFVLKGLHSRRP